MDARRAAALFSLLAALRLSGAETPPPALRVTLLGTGNPRPSMARFGPSILVEAGTSPPTRILVDAGRGATQRLFAFDVETRRDRDERLPGGGAVLGAKDVAPNSSFEVSGVKITAFAVDHGPVKPAYGYRIDYAGKSVVLSGDTRYSQNLVAHAKGCDVLVHEVVVPSVEMMRSAVADARKIRRIIEHHTTPEDAGRVFAEVKPRLAVYSHIVPSPATEEDLVAPTRKTYAGPLAVGYDLMSISIGEGITVEKREAAVE